MCFRVSYRCFFFFQIINLGEVLKHDVTIEVDLHGFVQLAAASADPRYESFNPVMGQPTPP